MNALYKGNSNITHFPGNNVNNSTCILKGKKKKKLTGNVKKNV